MRSINTKPTFATIDTVRLHRRACRRVLRRAMTNIGTTGGRGSSRTVLVAGRDRRCRRTGTWEGEAPAEPPMCFREQDDVLRAALDPRSRESRHWIRGGPNACSGSFRHQFQLGISVRLDAERCPVDSSWRLIAQRRLTRTFALLSRRISSLHLVWLAVTHWSSRPANTRFLSSVDDPGHGRAKLLLSRRCAFKNKKASSGRQSTLLFPKPPLDSRRSKRVFGVIPSSVSTRYFGSVGCRVLPSGQFLAVDRTAAAHEDVCPPVASDFVSPPGLVGGNALVLTAREYPVPQ